MVEMAKPWKHPETGVFHIRRQIPAALRSAFGGRQLHKVSLRTKDPSKAVVLFLQANAKLESEFEQARARLAATGSPLPSARDRADELVGGYFGGDAKTDGGLDGAERLLLGRIEVDRGLWNERPHSHGVGFLCSPGPSDIQRWLELSDNAALFKAHYIGKRHLDGLAPGAVWRWDDGSFHAGARDRQLARLVEQVLLHYNLDAADAPSELPAAIKAYLDELPIATVTARKPRPVVGRLRPDMRMKELFDLWLADKNPRPQTANEFRQATMAFVDLIGDIPVNDVTNDDLLDFRDEVAKLPVSMSRTDRQLSFTQQVAKFSRKDPIVPPAIRPARSGKLVSPSTVKKKVGAIQALLSFAAGEKWIKTNVGRDVPIIGYSKTAATPRRPFEDEDLARLFASPLFVQPDGWDWKRRTTDCTAYWLFLLVGTTGARIEEVGQALLSDVKREGNVIHIDIDDYVDEASVPQSDAAVDARKSLKNANSRRIIPVHDKVVELGFVAYCEALQAAGHRQLFPDLLPNTFGKRTQNASRRVNGLIDKLVGTDTRYVFHSLRHGFRDLATEAEIDGRVIDQICGHAPTTVGGRYGRGIRLAVLHRIFHKITWASCPGLKCRRRLNRSTGPPRQLITRGGPDDSRP